MTSADDPVPGRGPWLAALAALGLGALGAMLLVVGHHPWDGPEVTALFASHGLHRGDLLAIGPAVVGLALARWCLRTTGAGPKRSGRAGGSR